jgi:hypothetical protein
MIEVLIAVIEVDSVVTKADMATNAASIALQFRCMKPHVMTVVKSVKYHSDPQVRSQSTVVIVSTSAVTELLLVMEAIEISAVTVTSVIATTASEASAVTISTKKCFKQPAITVAKSVKFLSNHQAKSQCIVATVSAKKVAVTNAKVAMIVDQAPVLAQVQS